YLYLANGFLDAKVDTELLRDAGSEHEMRVVVNIKEGPQTRVQELKFEGVDDTDRQALGPKLTNVEGQPFSDANIATDRDAITYYYYDRGFPNVQLEATATPIKDDPNRVNVLYKVTQGQQVFVDHVIITGLDFTRPYIVDRQMRIQSGDPLSQSR